MAIVDKVVVNGGSNQTDDVKISMDGEAVALAAGSALVGKVGIDQTTPGTTNAVSVAQLGANTVATGNGASSTGVLRVAQVNDGTGVLATVSTVTNLSQMGGVAIALNTGVRSTGTQRVTIATDDIVQVGGDKAHDTVDSGNPVKVGYKAINAFPTAVSSADRANGVSDLYGRQLVGHIDAAQQIWKSYNSTTSIGAGSAAIIWTPASGKKIAITSLTISTYGTTAARIFLFFAAAADLTYTAGTDQPVFVGSFAPTTSSKPGLVLALQVPIIANTADYKLLFQNDNAISIDIVVHGYEL